MSLAFIDLVSPNKHWHWQVHGIKSKKSEGLMDEIMFIKLPIV